MWSSHKRKNSFKTAIEKVTIMQWQLAFSLYLFIYYAEAQIPSVQQIHFMPKSYFLQQQQQQQQQLVSPASSSSLIPSEPVAAESSIVEQPSSSIVELSPPPSSSSSAAASQTVEITRSPRHLAPDRYYVDSSVGVDVNAAVEEDEDQSATATTSLRANALDRAGNPIRFNGLVDQELKLDIRNDNPNNNHFEAKILPHSQSINPRGKSIRYKSRRTKTRPPKNVIIYSLPEQSFYARPSTSHEDTSSYSEPDSREGVGLRSDLGEDTPEQQQQQLQQQQFQQQQADSKEFRAAANSNLLSQKKALLGQCMAQCLDAIL